MLTLKLKKVRDALLTVTKNVNHYESLNNKENYIVWQEEQEGTSLHCNDKKGEQVLKGTIDLFTKDEYSSLVDKVQEALNEFNISYVLNSVQYESETKLIHYEWLFEVV